jgi:hypothetical protein
MRFVALIYQNEDAQKGFSKEDWGKVYAEYQAVGRDLTEKGQLLAGHGLQPVAQARTVRERAGKVEVDAGPCFHTPDQLSGVNLLEAPDMEAALQIAGRLPSVRWGAIEVRPLMEYRPSAEGTYGA